MMVMVMMMVMVTVMVMVMVMVMLDGPKGDEKMKGGLCRMPKAGRTAWASIPASYPSQASVSCDTHSTLTPSARSSSK